MVLRVFRCFTCRKKNAEIQDRDELSRRGIHVDLVLMYKQTNVDVCHLLKEGYFKVYEEKYFPKVYRENSL